MDQSILVVCAHPDDESLGAGGTIASHTMRGVPIDVLCLTGNTTREAEMRAACNELGVRNLITKIRDDFAIDMTVKDEVVQTILDFRPSILITHSRDDYNQNHATCAEIVSQAVEWASHTTIFEDAHRVERIYHMEINSLLSRPHVLVDITESYDIALNALCSHESQIRKANRFYPRFYDVRTLLRGVQAGCQRAEAFTIEMPFHAGPFYPRNSVKSLI